MSEQSKHIKSMTKLESSLGMKKLFDILLKSSLKLHLSRKLLLIASQKETAPEQ